MKQKREMSGKELVIMNAVAKDQRLCGLVYALICGYRNGEAKAKGAAE